MTTPPKTFEDFGIQVTGSGEVSITCPQCSAGRKKKNDRCLSVNTDKGVWHCNHCEWSGGLGNGANNYQPTMPKDYKKPEFQFKPDLPEETYLYLVEKRKIVPTVLQRNRVCSKDDAILFPFYRDGECLNIKHYIPAKKDEPKKYWQTTGAEKILYGFDDINDARTIITEGELDKLSCEVAGFKNAVSVPSGAKAFDFFDNCKERLDSVKHFVLAVDNDEDGKKLEDELVRRLGPDRCSRVSWPEGCKDANDVLMEHGPEVLAHVIESAVPFPVEGIFRVDDIDLETLYKRGLEAGASPGWVSVEELYTVAKEAGELTIVTGIPGHGKSEWLDAVLVNLAESEGWRFGVCSPENYPIEYHLSKLASKYIGQPFGDGHKTRMSPQEMTEAKAWMGDHFSFLMPDEDHLTVDAVLKLARILVYQRGIRGLVIDPWNELDHSRPEGMSETEFISQSLTKIRRFARFHGCHVWLVAHPTKMPKGTDGVYPVPTPYDISGSAHWRNKADNCIAVWRDTNPVNQSLKMEIHVQKIRKKHIGRLGKAVLRYEDSTGRYFDV